MGSPIIRLVLIFNDFERPNSRSFKVIHITIGFYRAKEWSTLTRITAYVTVKH